MLQALRLPDTKAAVEKEWEKMEKFSAWNLTEVTNKKEVIDEARNKGRKVHFESLMDFLSSQEFGVETKISEVLGPSRTPR